MNWQRIRSQCVVLAIDTKKEEDGEWYVLPEWWPFGKLKQNV